MKIQTEKRGHYYMPLIITYANGKSVIGKYIYVAIYNENAILLILLIIYLYYPHLAVGCTTLTELVESP